MSLEVVPHIASVMVIKYSDIPNLLRMFEEIKRQELLGLEETRIGNRMNDKVKRDIIEFCEGLNS